MPRICETVDNAQPGSDIHGVLEKIAYKLHLKDRRESAGSNWYSAKEAIVDYIDKHNIGGQFNGIEDYLKAVLDFSAYSFRETGGTSFDHWMKAQNEIAESAYNDYCSLLQEWERRFKVLRSMNATA